MNYGLPYKGSKNKIAEWVVSHFPHKAHFYDLCAGGCAVTHCAMLQNKFETYTVNDVLDIPRLFVDAINGKYKNETRWISREDFFRLKDTDPYIKTCWSFGNDGKTYLYSREIEPYKRACHFAIVFDQWEELKNLCPEIVSACQNALKDKTDIKQRRIAFGPAVVKELKRLNDWNLVQNNLLYKSCHWRKNGLKEKHVDLQSLESLQSLQSLQSLERLERKLTITNGSYEEYVYKEGDVVYCDPPYEGTSDYSEHGAGAFDSQRFYDWALSQPYTIYISSYELPPAFTLIKEIPKISSFGNNHTITERLYTNKNTGRSWMRQMYFDFGD